MNRRFGARASRPQPNLVTGRVRRTNRMSAQAADEPSAPGSWPWPGRQDKVGPCIAAPDAGLSLAVIEAKSQDEPAASGLPQAKDYTKSWTCCLRNTPPTPKSNSPWSTIATSLPTARTATDRTAVPRM